MRAIERIAGRILTHFRANDILPGLHQLPEFVIDDAQVRHRG